MPRSRIDLDAVVAAAIGLVDRDGMEALTLSNVAEVLEVRPSALYTHVDGTRHLHYVIAVRATHTLTTQVRNAAVGVAGRDAVLSAANAYQQFAAQHPGQYEATLAPPSGDDGALADACAELVDVLALVLQGLGLTDDLADAAATSMRSTLHGFMALGSVDGSGAASDEFLDRFDRVVELLITGLVRD